MSLSRLRTKYADPAGRIATFEGVEVYYKDEGSGPPLLLIHGSFGTLRIYDDVASILIRRGYRVVRYDIPPAGLSGPVRESDLRNLKPEDLPQLILKHVGINHATCVGVSSGGTTCAFFASKYPQSVDRLVLSNTPSQPIKTDHVTYPRALRDAFAEEARTGRRTREYTDSFLDFFAASGRITEQAKEQAYDFNHVRAKTLPPTFVATVGTAPEETERRFGSISVPTLLVWGAKDPLLVPESANTLARYLVKAQTSLVLLPDAGHYPPLEFPDRFAAILATYIESVAPLGP